MSDTYTDTPPQRTFVKAHLAMGNTPRRVQKEFTMVVDYLFVPTHVQLTDAISVEVESSTWSPFNHCCELKLRRMVLNEPTYSETCKWLTEAGWKAVVV